MAMNHSEFLRDTLHARVALEHHERMDGTGYPNRMNGDQIHPVSKIVAVSDVYSAMISSRVYQKKRDLFYVLKELYRMSFTELDPIYNPYIHKAYDPEFHW